MRKKGAVKAAAWLMSACMLIGSLPAIPGMSRKVSAAETKIEGFATKEQLLTDYSMDGAAGKKIGKVTFGQNEEGTAQSWYIAGKDSATEDGLVLFAASPMKKSQVFYSSDFDHLYDTAWGCEYEGAAPSEVYANHYGGSEIRKVLKNLASDPSYFTEAEQKIMRETAVRTNDTRNKSIYTTKDKLYLASGEVESKQISVGTNDGLKIALDKYDNGSTVHVWLRPEGIIGEDALLARPSGGIQEGEVVCDFVAAPALQLNLTSVIFASAAPAATSEGSQETREKDMILRYDAGDNLGSVAILDHKTAEVKKTAENRYLVVQNDRGAWRKKAENETTVSAKEVTIDGKAPNSFKGCKVWLEKTDATRITKATRPDQTGEKLSEYTVTFKDYDGKVLETQKVKYEEGAKAPTAPTRAGYTFTGWDKEFRKVTGDLTVTAQYHKDSEPVKQKEPAKRSHGNPDNQIRYRKKTTQKIKISWKKKRKASGYVLYQKFGKRYRKVKTIKGKKKSAVLWVTARTSYNFKVRPYRMVKGKIRYQKMQKGKRKAGIIKVQFFFSGVPAGKSYQLQIKSGKKGKAYKKASYKGKRRVKGNARGIITYRINAKKGYVYDARLLSGTQKKQSHVKIIRGKKTLKKGKSWTFKAKVYGINGKIKWSVSNKKIGSISKKGRFKAKKKGKVYVTARCGKYKAKICVKVK
ncbi:InlB B-repeat-containing protein [Anaerostipes caccae]|uniref:InlB B-repeat-containing protein n=1 Tax=Anaerostipes caccae TaxID=105841 RepID=UPI0038D4E9BB